MEIKNLKDLGQLIKNKRKELNMTQADLALVTGVSIRLVVGLENGKRNVGINTVINICSLLGVKLNIG